MFESGTHPSLTMKSAFKHLRVALVHDWLTGMRGGEKVLEVLCELFPDATLFTLLHNPGSTSPTIERMRIRTSFVQQLPLKSEKYRNYLPFFPAAIESLDLSGFDLIISNSHCVAKGVIPPPGALHICYCHTPMRYVWDQYDDYFGKGRAGLMTRTAMRIVAPRLREWDVRTSSRVHHFIANSQNVSERIKRIYGRESDVLRAPVDTKRFVASARNDGYYLVVSALVPYKRVDLAVEAFNNSGKRLVIVGAGPELKKLRSLARPHVEFLGWRSDEELAGMYARCKALIFPGEEDFGIVPLEAMAAGKPVVAYARGGALETVIEKGKLPTGVFFEEQTSESLLGAIQRLGERKWNSAAIRRWAKKFDRERFKQELQRAIEKKLRGGR